jgi:hypothetical protein
MRRQARYRLSALLVFLLPLQSTGCGLFAPQVQLDRVEAQRISTELSAFVLTDSVASTTTRSILYFYDLQDTFAADPVAAVRELHGHAAREPYRVLLFGLAEACFLAGREAENRDYFLAAAVYAYLYLFGEDDPTPADPFDRKFRWACDLYNQSMPLLPRPPAHDPGGPQDLAAAPARIQRAGRPGCGPRRGQRHGGKAVVLLGVVQLYKALGGGWQSEPPASPPAGARGEEPWPSLHPRSSRKTDRRSMKDQHPRC